MIHAHLLCSRGMSVSGVTLLALGSNQPTAGVTKTATMRCALDLLNARGMILVAESKFYQSEPLGSVRQPPFVNAVVAVRTTESLARILRIIKQVERLMGRRAGVRWGPRVIDIDIISHRGQCASGQPLGWVDRRGRPTVMRRGQLTSPHPGAHCRMFVLQPLCDIMPYWFHPVFRRSAKQLLRRLPQSRQKRLTTVA